jgi:hypothetical protein
MQDIRLIRNAAKLWDDKSAQALTSTAAGKIDSAFTPGEVRMTSPEQSAAANRRPDHESSRSGDLSAADAEPGRTGSRLAALLAF